MDGAFFEMNLEPITVELDFVEPAGSGRRPIVEGSEASLDEFRHWRALRARLLGSQLSGTQVPDVLALRLREGRFMDRKSIGRNTGFPPRVSAHMQDELPEARFRIAHLELMLEIAAANREQAWAALRMVREAIEELGPPGALPSMEQTQADFIAEAGHLVRGIQQLAR